jgi:mutator protein MutT
VKEITVVAGVIFNERGEVLLAQRASPPPHRGLWEYPGGKIENSETPEEALQREIQEELELAIKVERFIGEFCHEDEHFKVKILAFAAKSLSEKFQVKYHLDVRWVQVGQMKEYKLLPADEPIFPALISLKN